MVLIAIACVFILTTIGYFTLVNSPGWKFSRIYNELEPGMSQQEVRNLFGKKPDFDCRLGSSEIWYFQGPDDLAGSFDDVDLVRGSTVQTKNDLPDVYDHIQLAFDSGGHLFAYTWIGETYTVESTDGSASGSNLNKLPDSAFDSSER